MSTKAGVQTAVLAKKVAETVKENYGMWKDEEEALTLAQMYVLLKKRG